MAYTIKGFGCLNKATYPPMLKMNSYDTICSEHLEYYALSQIIWMADRVGLVIQKLSFNDVNGGSISIVLGKKTSKTKEPCPQAYEVENRETEPRSRPLFFHIWSLKPAFNQNRDQLLELIANIRGRGKVIYGYGASTKGNVLLQYCDLNDEDIPSIVEISEEKIGSYTPGSYIPIISELDAQNDPPDYYLVLPWHYKDTILQRELDYIDSGGKFIFPLPNPIIV